MTFLIPNYLMKNFKLLTQLVLELLTKYTWNFQNQYLILLLIGTTFCTMMKAFLILLKTLLRIGQDFWQNPLLLILAWLVYGFQVNYYMGPFKNYVDKILTIFDYIPTSLWTFFTLNVDKNKHFLTTYPLHLVHVVFEQPHTKQSF